MGNHERVTGIRAADRMDVMKDLAIPRPVTVAFGSNNEAYGAGGKTSNCEIREAV